ncbi:MAG TPA: hypothetical protein EYP90_14415, partial [Chromatiaceae bacterium]|nr:hypothetical protein [Chromatiaceae bacterium]
MIISPKSAGRLWVDAVQLREAKGLPSQFRPSLDDEVISRREGAVDWSPPPRAFKAEWREK